MAHKKYNVAYNYSYFSGHMFSRKNYKLDFREALYYFLSQNIK